MRRGTAAFTLIELMISGMMALLIGAGLFTLIRSSYNSEDEILGQNTALANSRSGVDNLADTLRAAKGFTSASASDMTFVDAAGNTTRMWLNGTNLRKTVNNLPSGGTVILTNVTSFSLVYWTWSGTAWSCTSSPSNAALVGAVDFTVNTSASSGSRQISGSVRLRQKRCTISGTTRTF